ncbi:putative tetrahydroberberine oxidase [Helianthus debilis subsp. tardiflorus]
MKSIHVDVGNRTAWVQHGALLGELYYSISQKTNTLYFPAGVCPTVGVGGYMGGGGKSMGEDLFWALRGGGTSSFGIVLAWKLRLVPVPEIVTVFGVNVTLEENATDVFYKYQYVAPRMDPDLLIRVRIFGEFIGNTTNKTIRLLFQGLYLGKTDSMLQLLDKSCWPELDLDLYKIKLDYMGGVIGSETAIPYPHRAGVLFQLLKGVNFADQTSDTTPTSLKRVQWLQSLEKLLEPYVSKNPRETYLNYIDLDLGVGRNTYEEASVWGERYWKRENFKKLIRIKAEVDPENFFRHPQSVGIIVIENPGPFGADGVVTAHTIIFIQPTIITVHHYESNKTNL